MQLLWWRLQRRRNHSIFGRNTRMLSEAVESSPSPCKLDHGGLEPKCSRHIWRGYVPHATADTLFAPPTSVTSHRVWRADADFGDAMAWNNELIKHNLLRKISQCNSTENVLRIHEIYSVQGLNVGRIRRNTAIETVIEKQCYYGRARITCNTLVMR